MNVLILSAIGILSMGNIKENLISSIAKVESSNNPTAVGDGGKAVGLLQIWPCVLDDVNRVYGKRYTLADRLDPVKSREICRLYLEHYGKNYTKKTGKQPTDEVYSRMWNGGPAGWSNKKTIEYWNKVKKGL